MKGYSKTLVIALFLSLCGGRVNSQTDEAAQLLLNVEKLAQLKQILSDMKKGYDILSKGYNTVKDISEGNFSLHKAFLDGLLEVSPAVRKYYKVAEIIDYQIRLAKEYKAALAGYQNSGSFRTDELDYFGRVYKKLLNESLENLDELTLVLTAGKLRMSDEERFAAIDRIHAQMEDKLNFLRHFNGQAGLLQLQREREQKSISTTQDIYGIDN